MPESAPDNKTSRLVALILDARRNGPVAVADELVPTELADAYRAQLLVASRAGRIAGWKVGAPSPTAEPFCAPLLADGFHPGGVTLPADFSRLWLLEGELMFTFGEHLPPREKPYERADVLAAVREVSAGFEILESRLAGWPKAPPLLNYADHGAHGGMVVGTGQPVSEMAFDKVRVRLTVDGRTVVDQQGGNSAGDPVRLLVWVANRLAAAEGGLRAGDLVTTGSCTGMEPLPPGATAEVAFGGFEPVRVSRGR